MAAVRPVGLCFSDLAVERVPAVASEHLAATEELRSSQADAARGDVSASLAHASDALAVEPYAASPRLQLALLRERQGDLGGAAGEIAAATNREPGDWRLWLTRSRIALERGEAGAGVDAFRRARSLNPRSPLFQPRSSP